MTGMADKAQGTVPSNGNKMVETGSMHYGDLVPFLL